MSPVRLPSPSAASLRRGALYTVFGGWFLATLLSQDPTRKHSGFRTYDPTGLFIADWRFFAPIPGMFDHHLLYRDQLDDGSLTPWQEVLQDRQRKVRQVLFFPTRRGDKAITDSVGSLLRIAQTRTEGEERQSVQVTIPYLSLLNFVTHQRPHDPRAIRTEFCLVKSAGYDESVEPEVLFLSNRHALAGRRGLVRA